MTLTRPLGEDAPAPPDVSAFAIERGFSRRRSPAWYRTVTRLVAAVAIAGVGFLGWTGWRQHAPVVVETAVVSSVYPSRALTLLNATGYVVAQRKASVASKATGRLEWLGVLEGSKVRAGEVIARLERRDAQATRDQVAANVQVAEANVGQGRAELAEAERAFRRSEDLFLEKFVSASAHDSAVARLAKAQAALAGYEASVVAARANLRVSEVALDQTLIRAPFDGVVITRNANVGDTITPFSQALDTKGAVVTIADMDTLEVEVDISESSISGIRVGQPVEIQLDAIPGKRFDGVVNRIVPTVDRAKAAIHAKIRFLRLDPAVLPDMSAKVAFLQREIVNAEREPVLAVPAKAVIAADGRKVVYVVDDGKARLRAVELGMAMGDHVELRGLEAGTRVVVRPPSDLTDGRPVKLEK